MRRLWMICVISYFAGVATRAVVTRIFARRREGHEMREWVRSMEREAER